MLVPPCVISAQCSCHPRDQIQARPVGQVAQLGRSPDQTLAFLAWLHATWHVYRQCQCLYTLRSQWGLNRQPSAGGSGGCLGHLTNGAFPPSSHDLPWLSKPLVHLIYSSTADQHHHKPQGIHPHPHRPCVTLASPLRNARTTYKTQLSPSYRVHITLVSPPMTD